MINMKCSVLCTSILVLILLNAHLCLALLRVVDSPTRQFKTLDGFWDFLPDYSGDSVNNQWWTQPLSEHGDTIPMPVPASFNDITTDAKLKDHLGWVWYETQFTTPTLWLNGSGQYDPSERQIFVRFESAHYYAMVYINGEYLTEHSIGHLPFEAEIGQYLITNDSSRMNRLTVALNNTLNATTVPPAAYNYKSNNTHFIYPEGFVEVNWQFDFYNYAGIHRPVKLYTTSGAHVDDITIKSYPESDDKQDAQDTWYCSLEVQISAPDSVPYRVEAKLLDDKGNLVSGEIRRQYDQQQLYESDVSSGTYQKDATFSLVFRGQPGYLWWSYTHTSDYGRMHVWKVEILSADSGKVLDVYEQKFGFRHVTWSNTSLFINGKKTYLTGINKHEDADIRGKGLDYALIGRDFQNQKWLNSNAFRTSHYPYAEEYLEMADSQGIMVIGECPGVGIEAQNMVAETLATHERSIREMIARDKNHPAIIMWSLANEPSSNADQAEDYFKDLFTTSRTLDDTRPFTFVTDQYYDQDYAIQFSDFVNVNRYIGWYNDITIGSYMPESVYYFVKQYHLKFNKPVIVQEYGAGTIAGFHKLPTTPFNEEYQWHVLNWTGLAFDRMREEFLVGEFIWNYADFMTEPETTRVDGNKKGIFTRQRQPKMAAHYLRYRYSNIVNNNAKHQPEYPINNYFDFMSKNKIVVF
ncbi:beta-glucuronidase-like [Convolutriloba macropyga]|uniref:beta-glucuronidase-like n=1 Tax=Convolutriloba macropyga TaxID=536237 RepID=UPI003F51BE91